MAKKVNLPPLATGFVDAAKSVATASANNTTLRNGSTGSQVKNLQAALAENGYDVGNIDGVYGPKTEAAVEKYQRDHGLTTDGIAGKDTLGSLSSSSSSSSSSSKSSSTSSSKNSSSNAQKVNIDSATAASGPIISATIAAGGKPNLPPLPVANTPPAEKPPAEKPPAEKSKTPPAETPKAAPPATPPTTGGTVGQPPVAPQQPFTYDPFTYDKQFTYDPFTYDKQFTYDDFSYGDFSYADYAESDIVKQANALLQQQNAAKPGAYQSMWQNQINDYMGRIENREAFSYDPNSDALYNMYKDMYVQQGQMAMMDTMGQAAAMTGGYGNSYAQTVGQQAYNQQLSQLNAVLPELYQQSYNRYADEGQRLQDMYNMYLGREEQDYGRYMDSYNQWQAERDYLANRYDFERDYDYSKWESNRNLAYDQYTSDRNLAYDQWSSGRDLAYDQYTADKNLAYDQYSAGRETAWQEYLNNLEKEQAAAELMAGADSYDRLASLYGLSADEVTALKDANAPKYTGGVVDDGKDDEPTWDNEGLSESRIKELQKALGVTVDGKWGEESKKAAGGLSATAAYDALRRGDFDDPDRPQGTMNDSYEGGLAETRRDQIYDWLLKAYKNAGSSFQPLKLVEQSGELKTQAERDYAKTLVESWYEIHK
jgi:peptidoglycan hydrolase-like protein with peptidoglycan-binding domain